MDSGRSSSDGGWSRGEKARVRSTYCGKNGHEVAQSFERTGEYPDWYLEKQRKNRAKSRRGRGHGGQG